MWTGAHQEKWALSWAEVYKEHLFRCKEDRPNDLRTKKSVGGKLAWEFGREQFIRERDDISGWMCYSYTPSTGAVSSRSSYG